MEQTLSKNCSGVEKGREKITLPSLLGTDSNTHELVKNFIQEQIHKRSVTRGIWGLGGDMEIE